MLKQIEYLDLRPINQPYGDVYGARRPAADAEAIGISNFYPACPILCCTNEMTIDARPIGPIRILS